MGTPSLPHKVSWSSYSFHFACEETEAARACGEIIEWRVDLALLTTGTVLFHPGSHYSYSSSPELQVTPGEHITSWLRWPVSLLVFVLANCAVPVKLEVLLNFTKHSLSFSLPGTRLYSRPCVRNRCLSMVCCSRFTDEENEAQRYYVRSQGKLVRSV